MGLIGVGVWLWLNLYLLWRQSALRRSLHFSWHFTPHSVHRTPWNTIKYFITKVKYKNISLQMWNIKIVQKGQCSEIFSDLSGDAPEKSLALVAVCWRGGGPENKVVRRRAGDRVDQRLQRLLEDVHFLQQDQCEASLVRLWDSPVPRCPGWVWAALTGRTWFSSPPES